MGTVRLILVLAVVAAVAAGYWYVRNLQNDLAVAAANNATLSTAVEINEATIQQLQEDYARIQQELNRVNTEFAASREQNDRLRERLSDNDLGFLAENRPGLVERAVNRGTDNAGRCFEILSGSPLTDQEREATSENEFNSECPWLWPGHDTAQ